MAGTKNMRRTRSKGLRARAWWVIRKDKRLTLGELLCSINDGESAQPERNIGTFLTCLTRAGVLTRQRVDDNKVTSNGVYLYYLNKDLGHKNPVIRKEGVYDPNSQQLLEYVSE